MSCRSSQRKGTPLTQTGPPTLPFTGLGTNQPSFWLDFAQIRRPIRQIGQMTSNQRRVR